MSSSERSRSSSEPGWFGELQKKRRALDRLLPTIRATSDQIMRDLYVTRASEVTGVDRSILLNELSVDRARPIIPQRQPIAPRINNEVRARRADRRTRPQCAQCISRAGAASRDAFSARES
jgi:hypothetical protein